MAEKTLRIGSKGEAVRVLQVATNARLLARQQPQFIIDADGDYGPSTAKAVSRAAYLLGITGTRFDRTKADNGGIADKTVQRVIQHPSARTPAMIARAVRRMGAVQKALAARPLRERAYEIAAREVGVMESGGNNMGTPFTRYQKSNGATGPEPWCGDFMAFCYRAAGSSAVQRLWASVYYLGRISGVVKTSSPKRGDLVRYSFDHVGMFVEHAGPGQIRTIEGNTGSSGAESDSSTGGDGVYRKVRSTSLVADYRHITR